MGLKSIQGVTLRVYEQMGAQNENAIITQRGRGRASLAEGTESAKDLRQRTRAERNQPSVAEGEGSG